MKYALLALALMLATPAYASGSFCHEVRECEPEPPEKRCLPFNVLYYPCAGSGFERVYEGDTRKIVALCRYDYETQAVSRVKFVRYRSVIDATVDAFTRNDSLCHRINIPPYEHVPWYME
jgi:hypothetical protein